MSRPSSSYGQNNHSNSNNSRPSTASSRPSTASTTRRHLTYSSYENNIPTNDNSFPSSSSSAAIKAREDKDKEISNEIILRELDQDNLLRIMNYNKIEIENEAFLVIEGNNLKRLKELIEFHGLIVSECRGLHGYSLLHHAASKGHNLLIAELLKQDRISVDVTNQLKETPLHLAVYSGHLLTVDQLLDYGANINAVNSDQETCLFYAARKGYSAIIRLLISRGINFQLEDKYGEKAIDHITNPLAIKAFELAKNREEQIQDVLKNKNQREGGIRAEQLLTYDNLLITFSFLDIIDILKSACVCSKWHRVSEHPQIWKSLGIRKWEFALQNSLGFGLTASSSFLKPPRRSNSSSSSNLLTSQSNKVKKSSSSDYSHK